MNDVDKRGVYLVLLKGGQGLPIGRLDHALFLSPLSNERFFMLGMISGKGIF